MSFLLRASLVIGLLAFFASKRDRTDPLAGGRDAASFGSQVVTLEAALPAETRELAIRTGMQELTRRVASAGPSQDTLSETDRRLPWRGIAAR